MSPILFKFKQINQSLLVVFLIGISTCQSSFAQPGALDVSWGGSGIVTTDVDTGADRGFTVFQQSDGKVVVGGLSNNGTNNDFALTRYLPNGTLDASWGTGGVVITPVGLSNETGQAAIQQVDGKIIMAGFAFNGANNDVALVRYNTDGSLDNTFGGTGIVITPVGAGIDQGHAIALQANGKVLVAGFSFNGTNNDFAVLRYTTGGVLDPTFDTDGIVTTDFATTVDCARAVQVQADGKIVLAGWSSNGTNLDFAVARYDTTGALDPSFDTDGKVITDFIGFDDQGYSMVIQPDNKILVSGVKSDGVTSDFGIVRYHPDGSLDLSFDTDGKVTTDFFSDNDFGYSIALQSDGKIMVGGQCKNGTNQDFGLARYLPSGTLDITYDTDGLVNTDLGGGNNDIGWAVTVQADGRTVVAGSNNLSSTSSFGVTRYYTCEIVDTSLTWVPVDSSLNSNASGFGYEYQWVNCDSSYSTIIGETNPFYMLTSNGSYAVIISATSECSDTSSCFTIVNLSTEKYGFDNTVFVFPNPTVGPLTLAFEKPLENASFNLMNLSGQVLMSRTNVNGYKVGFDISTQTSGLYILEVRQGNQVARLKVVKQ
jgi:uncharacterized delta-60 repeat protein